MKIRNLIIAFLLLAGLVCPATAAPKYIFYFIGDGMGHGAVMLAQLYKSRVLGDSLPLSMLSMPVVTMATTYSASSPVTDSAAAGTALATGHKTKHGMLGMTADTVAVNSVAKVLHDNGFGVGLVTTVAPDDATPGAFYAHQPNRSMYFEIGKQAASSGYDFIAGANLRGGKNNPARRHELLQAFEENDVRIVRGVDGLNRLDAKKILLLNADTASWNEIGYSVDSLPGVLTLPAMTQACLDHLTANRPDRFFMMVEGGSIDHAGHANDPAASVQETLTFDKCIGIALDFYRKHPDETLIVVTADHETGGLALGNKELHYDMNPGVLKYSRMSIGRFSDECKAMLKSRRIYTWDDMRDILRDNFGLFGPVDVSEKDEAALRTQFEQTFELRNSADRKTLYDSFNAFADSVFALISRLSGAGWTTGFHTGSPVPVFAIGAGSEAFSGMNDNTMIPVKILNAAGYRF